MSNGFDCLGGIDVSRIFRSVTGGGGSNQIVPIHQENDDGNDTLRLSTLINIADDMSQAIQNGDYPNTMDNDVIQYFLNYDIPEHRVEMLLDPYIQIRGRNEREKQSKKIKLDNLKHALNEFIEGRTDEQYWNLRQHLAETLNEFRSRYDKQIPEQIRTDEETPEVEMINTHNIGFVPFERGEIEETVATAVVGVVPPEEAKVAFGGDEREDIRRIPHGRMISYHFDNALFDLQNDEHIATNGHPITRQNEED